MKHKKNNSRKTFEITIPVLDEAETLEQQIRLLHAFLKKHFPDPGQWSILIADNGSTDDTPRIAEELCQKLPEVRFIRLPERGVGLALKTSWAQATTDIIGYMDLDFSTDLRHFLQAWEMLTQKGCQLVYGTRLHPQSKVIGRSLKREISSRVFNFILKRYLGVHFSDGMCGFKFLHRDIYPRLYEAGAQNNGWFFSTELLVTAEWTHINLCELPVTWTDDPHNSRVKIIPLALKYLKAMKNLKEWKINQ